MKKAKKNILFSLIMLYSFFFSITQVNANNINKIDMDVYVDSNGNATITEVWNAYLSQGTEGYRPYTKLGNSSISNFSVSDDSGRTYESISYWNTSDSFANKAYKNGIHNILNGVELCWGISSYGNRTYTLKYNISNFVTQYTDKQGIYFNFLNLDQSVGNAKITIHSATPFSLDNARIWAFGNSGSINFENGSIVLESNGSLSSSQYMVALVRFESNLFNTTNKSSNSFDNIYDSAMSDVNKKEFESNSDSSEFSFTRLVFTMIFGMIVMLLFNPIMWIIVLYFIIKKKSWGSEKKSVSLDFGTQGKTLPSDNKINYWREIPCNKDLERAYWLLIIIMLYLQLP